MTRTATIAISVFLFCTQGSAQFGALDPSFSSDGITILELPPNNSFGRKVLVQEDGRILVAGNTFVNGLSAFTAARFLSNGDLDLSWDTVGYTLTAFSTSDAAFDMALQNDGMVVLTGTSIDLSSGIRVARFTDQGLPDLAFGSNGSVLITIPGQFQVEVYGLAIQADGRLLICGVAYGDVGRLFVARLLGNGDVDTSFGNAGFSLVEEGDACIGYDLLLRNDGRILVGGYAEDSDGADYFLAQLNSDGSMDDSFGTDGEVRTDLGDTWERIQAIAVDVDQRIVCTGASGEGFNFITHDAAILRYTVNGGLDASFGTNGLVLIDHAAEGDQGSDVLLQPDGKIVACGYAGEGGQDMFSLWRLLENGSLDPSFGTSGMVLTEMGFGGGAAASVDLQDDGRIVAAGSAYDPFVSGIAVARYSSGLPVGLEGPSRETIGLFPNPVQDHLTVNTEFEATLVDLIDAKGRVLRSDRPGSSRFEMDLRDLPPGNYSLRLSNGSRGVLGLFTKL